MASAKGGQPDNWDSEEDMMETGTINKVIYFSIQVGQRLPNAGGHTFLGDSFPIIMVLMSKRTANVRKFPTIWHASARPLPAQQYSPSQTQTLGQIINLTKCLGQDILMLIYFHN